MRKRISRAAYYKACLTPRQRFSKLRVGRDGGVNVRAALPPDWRSVWFELDQVHEDDGAYYFDANSYSVYMFVDGVLSVVFYVEAGTVLSVSFSAQLNTEQLAHAARALRDAGLGRFVTQAARQTLQYAPAGPRKVLGAALRKLTGSSARGRG